MRPMLSCQVQLELFHTPEFLKHTDYSTQNSTPFHTLSHLYFNSVASSNIIIKNIFTSHHSYVQASHFRTTFICLLLIRLNSTDRSSIIGVDTEDGGSKKQSCDFFPRSSSIEGDTCYFLLDLGRVEYYTSAKVRY
jgi:hypothetical protein